MGQPGRIYLSFLKELKEHPDDIAIQMPLEFTCDESLITRIPNNIPTPDYEYEGGFVGREDDIKKINSLIEGQHPVITISGAGGVGKTALALRVIQVLLQKPDCIFDGIVWLSAKESKLSYLGIEDIEPTVKNYEDLLDTIFMVMGFGDPSEIIEKKESDIKTIFNLHTKILIIIDNLETITDERIINFIFEPHPKIKILITSRKGLGQVERRYDLQQLKEKEAMYLFRQIAKDKNLTSLAKLDDTTIHDLVIKVSCYPLAIKWVLGQVALGKNISEVIGSINETTSDISLFCFEQIYREISTPAKNILCALSCFDEPPSGGVLMYVVGINQEKFDDGISELILVSLVIPEQFKDEQGNISSRFILLSLTRGYVRQQLDKNPVLKRDIEDRMQTVRNTIEEAERAKKQYRYSLSNMGAITEEEKVAALMAQTAYQKYQSGRYIDAVEDYKRAADIAPNFTSLFRNWAVMESQEKNYVEADKLMRKATGKSPDDPQLWLTWGNIKRRADKLKEALEYYQKAFKLSPNDPVILNAMGQAKSRLGEYKEADDLFSLALQKETMGAFSVKHEIINKSSMADNLARWSEALINDRDNIEAEKKLKKALGLSEEVIKLDPTDVKSLDLYRHIVISLGYFYKKSKPEMAISYFGKAIIQRPRRYREGYDTLVASVQSAKIYLKLGEIEKAKEVLSPNVLRIRELLRKNPKLQEDLRILLDEIKGIDSFVEGKIIRLEEERKFCIIEQLSSPGNTFLGILREFKPRISDFETSLLNKIVRFIPDEITINGEQKKIAKSIRLKPSIGSE